MSILSKESPPQNVMHLRYHNCLMCLCWYSRQITTSPPGSFHFGLFSYVLVTDTCLPPRGKARLQEMKRNNTRPLESYILLSFYGYFGSRANSLCDFPTFTCFLLRSMNIFLLSSLDFLLLISTWFLGVTFSLPDVSFTIGSTLPLLYNRIWGAGKTTSVWACHPALYFLGNGKGEVNPSGCQDNYAAGCKTLHYLAPRAHMFGRALTWMPSTQTLSSCVNTTAFGAFVFTTFTILVPLLLTLIAYRYAGMW